MLAPAAPSSGRCVRRSQPPARSPASRRHPLSRTPRPRPRGLPRKPQDVLHPPLDPGQQGKGPPAGAAAAVSAHPVGHLIADQGQRPGEQDRDQQPGADGARRHRHPGLIHRFDDDQVLVRCDCCQMSTVTRCPPSRWPHRRHWVPIPRRPAFPRRPVRSTPRGRTSPIAALWSADPLAAPRTGAAGQTRSRPAARAGTCSARQPSRTGGWSHPAAVWAQTETAGRPRPPPTGASDCGRRPPQRATAWSARPVPRPSHWRGHRRQARWPTRSGPRRRCLCGRWFPPSPQPTTARARAAQDRRSRPPSPASDPQYRPASARGR